MKDNIPEDKNTVIEAIRNLNTDLPFMVMYTVTNGNVSQSFVYTNLPSIKQVGLYELMKYRKIQEVEEAARNSELIAEDKE